MSEKIECKIPPEGWRCTRYAGHEGPCAAKPTPAAQEFVHDENCECSDAHSAYCVSQATAEKDVRIAELTQEVAETENELLEHSKALAAQDKKIAELEAELRNTYDQLLNSGEKAEADNASLRKQLEGKQ